MRRLLVSARFSKRLIVGRVENIYSTLRVAETKRGSNSSGWQQVARVRLNGLPARVLAKCGYGKRLIYGGVEMCRACGLDFP